MKKRILSLILTVLMMLSLFSVFSINASAASAIEFTYKPTVYIGGGGEYNIVWKTNVNSIAYVTYKYAGKTYTVYDEENGVVRSDDHTHSVRVPQDHLDAAGSYVAYSVMVNSRTDYNFSLGTVVSVSSSFIGYHKQSEIKFAFFSDTHLEPNKWDKSTLTQSKIHLDQYMGGADVIVLNGDIANNMPTEAYFDVILEISYTLSGGSLPVLYAKGNHECRGYYAQKLYKYLVFNTNEFYCQWDYGPVSVITIDIGEDKEDSHEEYYGVDDMDHYFEEQYYWLENMNGYTSGSTYNLSIGHSPRFIDRYMTDEYASLMRNYGTDVLVCGHSHSQKFVAASSSPIDIPTVHDGAHTDNMYMRTTLLTMSGGTYHFKAFSETGSIVYEQSLSVGSGRGTSALEENVEEEPAETVEETQTAETAEETETVSGEKSDVAAVPTAAGVSTMALKGAAETISINIKPVVFDCGSYYCVVWQTTAGVECAGYVEIVSGNATSSYMDSFAGKLRTETTHSVKIPKRVLDGATYYVRNRVVTCYGMYGIVGTPKTSYGPYVSGSSIKFLGDSSTSQKKYTIIAVTNTKVTATEANKIKSSYTGNPNLIVSLGNMVDSINTEADFGQYLQCMNILTGGSIPVLFLRGEGETTGEFAANIGRYIRNTTDSAVIGKFYVNSTYGDLSIVGLDTATGSADSASKYNGYAYFDSIRAEQVAWMQDGIYNSFKGTYNIVFAHGDGLSNYLGVNFTQGFSRLGTNLVVTGQSGTASFTDGGKSYATATCGAMSGDGTCGLMITCQNNTITVKSLGTGGAELGTVDVTTSSASNDEDNGNSDKPGNNPGTDNPGTSNGGTNNGGTSNTGTSNGGTSNTGTSNGGTNNTDTSNGGTGNTGTNNGGISNPGDTVYKPAEFDGIDGDMYIRTVPDGWYYDYLGSGFTYKVVTSVSSNGVMTEGVFIEIVAGMSGVNLALYTDSTNAAKASAWATDYGIYSGYLGGDNVLTDNVISTVISGLFTA